MHVTPPSLCQCAVHASLPLHLPGVTYATTDNVHLSLTSSDVYHIAEPVYGATAPPNSGHHFAESCKHEFFLGGEGKKKGLAASQRITVYSAKNVIVRPLRNRECYPL